MRELQETYTQSLRDSETPAALFGIFQNVFPLLYKKLDSHAWKKLIRDFFLSYPITTPFVHEIPDNFVEYLHTHSDKEIFELAHYDWVEFALAIDNTDLARLNINTEGDYILGIPVISPLAYLLHYETPEEKYYIAYRDKAHDVFYVTINLFSAKFFELLKNNTSHSGEAVLKQLAIETHHPNPDQMEKHGIDLLKQWHEKDIILGTTC